MRYLLAIAGFAVLSSPGSSFAQQSSLDGFYGQIGVGMSSATPSFNNDNVAAGGGRYGYTPGNINTANSFTGTATAGYNLQVNEGFLLGAGVEYSPITGHGTNYTLLSPALGSGYTRYGTAKLQNNYNILSLQASLLVKIVGCIQNLASQVRKCSLITPQKI
jgi:hypothetical protein